ncbi:hypothetical protein AGMMS49579_22580 [Spirochaetia bacterium]|nr:hypothetical protein AGMMS49579_22580 [Spirochaetia bacterium]
MAKGYASGSIADGGGTVMRKHCFFLALVFLHTFFLTAQEKIVIECNISNHKRDDIHYTSEIIFDDQGIIKSYTDSGSIRTVVKEGNIYTVTDTSTNSENEVWKAKEETHFIREKDGILTVWWNTTMQPITVAITENTIKLETGTRLNFSMDTNMMIFGRYVLSYEGGRLAKIEDPKEAQFFTVTCRNFRQYTIDVLTPGSGVDTYRIQADTTPKTMRQNAINFLILLFNKPVSYIPFIIGRY